MNISTVKKLRCPKTGSTLRIEDEQQIDDANVTSGFLIDNSGENRYPIINSIPRFVPESNYADNFGMQWNRFSKTQLDSNSGHPISSDRFWKATGWTEESLKDKWVLDVGCGSGRFAEIALKAGAYVVALDYSSAVDACWDNLKDHSRLTVVQGDIYCLPFEASYFDFVYSLGVLQHTPDVEAAFKSLPRVLKKNGNLCVDYYWRRFRTLMNIKYVLLPFTRKMDQERLFTLLERSIPSLLLVSNIFRKIPVIGKVLQRLIPVANYNGIYPLNQTQMREWALLDTFDMLGPSYDTPQTEGTITKWMEEEGFENIESLHATLLVVRGLKK
jgi:ubiquinone/menaquinone biosynthesis C-methylase UbiE/uncharacterized protein YbaR (Trm112 family)